MAALPSRSKHFKTRRSVRALCRVVEICLLGMMLLLSVCGMNMAEHHGRVDQLLKEAETMNAVMSSITTPKEVMEQYFRQTILPFHSMLWGIKDANGKIVLSASTQDLPPDEAAKIVSPLH